METTENHLKEQLKLLPDSPGVYLFKDSHDTITYVGKASSLRSRVRSYVTSPDKQLPKTQRLVEKITDLEFYVTNTE